MQSFASETSRLPEADRRAIAQAITPSTLDAIAVAPLLGWLPFSVNLSYTRALATQLGRERTHEYFRRLLLRVSETPLLHGFVRSALRATFGNPALSLPWLGKGWELIFRDCGRMANVKRRTETGAMFELHGLPAEALMDRYWVDSVASAVSGLAELLDHHATVFASEMDPRSGTAIFSGTWRARPGVSAR